MRRGLFPGLLLIGAGAYLLAANFGMRVPQIGSLWPLLPTLLGIFLLTEAITKNKDAIFAAVLFTLTGLFFFAFTLGYLPWAEMYRLWPAFPTIMGISFLSLYLVKLDWGLLIPTGIFLGVGVIFFAINYGYLNAIVLAYIWKLWPVVLIILGLSLIIGRAVKQQKQS